MMELKTFSDNFELLTDAPNGVQKLREMILQLAVQGKLVSQDSNDEPASVLLEKISKTKSLPVIGPDEVPYGLPDGWEWARLDDVSKNIHYGYTASADHNIKGVRLLRITDIQNGHVDWENVPGCKIEKSRIDRYRLNSGDLLIARTGGTIGKTFLIEDVSLIAVFASYLIRVIPREEIFPQYLKYFAISPLYWQQLYEKCSGTGQPNVNATSLKTLAIPLPPLNEQKRIVTKVDELMGICDELEARKQKAATNCIRLNDASLDGLVTATEPKKFNKHWQGICDSFDILYSRPENVVKLRQAILQLAVQGKLVPQDPRDEPTSVLLEKIKAEKERIVQTGKVRKAEPLPAIKVNDLPYELPGNWEWVRFGSIINIKSGSTIDQHFEIQKKDGSIPYLKVADMNLPGNEKSIFTSSRYVVVTKANQKLIIPPNSIIFPKRGGAIATNKKRLVNISIFADSNCMAVNCSGLMSLDYLFCWFKHIDLWKLNSGTSVPQINNKDIEPLLFSLPPIQEQKRIVAKVDELMGSCDRLEAGLSKSQIDCNTLMEAAVAEIMAA